MDEIPPTPELRQVALLAMVEAGRLRHGDVRPEHLLLGMIRKGDGMAVRLLKQCDIDLQSLKECVEALARLVETRGRGTYRADPATMKVLEAAIQCAVQLRQSRVGPEHLLLGLLKRGGSIAATCLRQSGMTFEMAMRAARRNRRD